MNNLNKNYEDLSFDDFTIRLFKAEKEYEANTGVAPITIKSSGYLESFDLCYVQISDADNISLEYERKRIYDELFNLLPTDDNGDLNYGEAQFKPVPDREEEMREMLDECRAQLEFLNDLQERGTTNNVLSRLKTLLNELKQ